MRKAWLTLALVAALPAMLTACPAPTSTPTFPPRPAPTEALVPTPVAGTPTLTPTPPATPTPTPIPPPVASFSFENGGGPAPLTVRFVNTSLHATDYVWDFGDGSTSTEINPQHTYTKAGRYTIRLEASSNVEGIRNSNLFVTRDSVEVRPGPLAKLTVRPENIELEPEQEIQIAVEAADEFGNAITDFTASWLATPVMGAVQQTGKFKAGTKAGQYTQGITVAGSYLGVTKDAQVQVTIVPGPIAVTRLTSSSPVLYTGDKVTLTLEVFDKYGNAVTPLAADYQATVGTIQGGATSGIFQAG